jgi:hypothetical protein
MRSRPYTRLATGLSVALLLFSTGCVAAEDGGPGSSTKAKPMATAAPSADSSSASTTPTPATDPAPTTTPTPTPTPHPPPTVPKVSGLSQADAEQALVAAGFVLGEMTEVPSARAAGTVLRQSVEFGTALAAGSVVALALAVPFPPVPAVVGRTQRVAVGILQAAGFAVKVTEETRTSGRNGAVLSQAPGQGKLVKPGALVTIVVANVVRPVAPPVSHSCSAGYKPCLPPASDYDCAGGSGNGPGYADGPIYVSGSDPYDLDADGDGVACEW